MVSKVEDFKNISKVRGDVACIFILLVLFSPNLIGTYLANFWPIVEFILIFSSFVFIKKYYKNNFLLLIPFLIFFLISFLNSIFFSEYDFSLRLKEIFRNLLYLGVIFFFLTFSVREKEVFEKKLCNIIIFFSLSSIVIYFLTLNSIWFEGLIFKLYYNLAGDLDNLAYSRSRIALTIGNPNTLSFCASIFFFIFLLKGRWEGNWKVIILIILAILVLLSFSRTGYISFLMSLVLYLFLFYRKSIKIIIFIFLFASFLMLFFDDVFVNFIERITYTSLGGREALWIDALKSKNMEDNFLLGLFIIPDGIFIDNDYVTIFFKYGLLGFLTYISIIFILFYLSLRDIYIDLEKRKQNFIILMLLFHMVIFSITSSVLTSYKMALLLLPLLSLFCLSSFIRRKK